MPAEQVFTILFADVSGSTPLYERLGDRAAASLIGECLDGLIDIAKTKQGNIVHSRGDNILATFPDALMVVTAAQEMIEVQNNQEINIHIGIHRGPAVQARDNLFGDTVNMAARLPSIAKPGEILVSSSVVDQLPTEHEFQLRLLDQQPIKGKSEPLSIYSVITDEDEDATRMMMPNGEQTVLLRRIESPNTPKVTVFITRGDQTIVFREGDPALRIGRSKNCDLIVEETCVSREHALLEVQRGKVAISDQSSTGTWVCLEGRPAVYLRRENLLVAGGGYITLGQEPYVESPSAIFFELSLEDE